MFTGLVESMGQVAQVEDLGQSRRLWFEAEAEFASSLTTGDSVSVNGVCLTVVENSASVFAVMAVEETLRRTTLGGFVVGQPVNLERALAAQGRFGGHIVQGHIDGVANVCGVRPEGEGWWITLEPALHSMRYIAVKGSVCLDGISLTVANVAYSKFAVALIPHTRSVTTAGAWSEGTGVNLELDIVAKYVEQLVKWVPGSQSAD